MEFGINVLIGAIEGSEVEIISETYGSEEQADLEKLVHDGHVKKIFLERGQCLVMGPDLRHKGVGYIERNVRLFLDFLVRRSFRASFSSMYDLDDISKEKIFVKYVLDFFTGKR